LSHSLGCDECGSAVAQAASHRLRESQYLDLRAVECSCEDGRLALKGQVPSYYLMQMASSLVSQVPGVERIENRLEVVQR
jgi:osmotically-inducible protein OsmY